MRDHNRGQGLTCKRQKTMTLLGKEFCWLLLGLHERSRDETVMPISGRRGVDFY